MNTWRVPTNKIAFVSSVVAHLLAWAGFLWLAFWPSTYRGQSVTAVRVDQVSTVEPEVVRYSASWAEVNGSGALIWVFVPVLVTGLVLMFLLTWQGGQGRRTLIAWSLALALLVYCGVGLLSIGVLFLPAALAALVCAIFSSFSAEQPRAGVAERQPDQPLEQ